MSDLILFKNKTIGQIRAIYKNNEALFIAKDVAKILEYSDAEAMTRRLDDDEVQNLQIVGFGNRGVNVINESGLYNAILGSKKPQAKKFKKWVTSEVLPAIRKTGEYRMELDYNKVFEDFIVGDYEKGYKDAINSLGEKIRQARYEGAMALERLYKTTKASKINIDQDWLLNLKRYTMMGLMQKEIAKLLGCSKDTVRRYKKLMIQSGLLPDKKQKLPELENSIPKGILY